MFHSLTVQHLNVTLGERSYPITVGPRLREHIAGQMAALREARRQMVVVTDETVAATQADYLRGAFGSATPVLALPAGETTKSIAALVHCFEFFSQQRLDRQGIVVAFGGGVVGDLAGFAAATWLRGVDFYQVPTTLLAMVDSAVGGKTGINLPVGKNLVGAFYQPKAVWCDTELLETLPAREFSAGAAEVIKYGLLAQRPLFELLETVPPLTPAHPHLPAIIRACLLIKAEIVGDDERELNPGGGRMLLNLGHTFGHAIEAVAGYGTYLHGEAVAIGLVLAARLSARLGLVGADVPERVARVCARQALPTTLRAPLPLAELVAAMARDKKASAAGLRLIVLAEVGRAAVQTGVAPELIAELWREVGAEG